MKNFQLTLLLFGFFLALLFSCKKEKSKLDFPIWNTNPYIAETATAERNGERWVATARAYKFGDNNTVPPVKYDSIISIAFFTYNFSENDTFLREFISIVPVPLKIGSYLIRCGDAYTANVDYAVLFDGGDTPGFSGYLNKDGDTEQFIEITKIDKQTNIISGKFGFDFHFFDNGHPYYEIPRTVKFTKGVFTAKIVQ